MDRMDRIKRGYGPSGARQGSVKKPDFKPGPPTGRTTTNQNAHCCATTNIMGGICVWCIVGSVWLKKKRWVKRCGPCGHHGQTRTSTDKHKKEKRIL